MAKPWFLIKAMSGALPSQKDGKMVKFLLTSFVLIAALKGF